MGSLRYIEDDQVHKVAFEFDGRHLTVGERSYPCDGRSVLLNGKRVPFWVHRREGRAEVWLDGEVYHFEVDDPRRRSGSGAGATAAGGHVTAQMPGKVLQVSVRVGDSVDEGDNLLLMESMKMELALDAPVAGVVKRVEVKPDQMVAQGDTLVEIEEG